MYENVLETLSVVEKTGSDFNPVTTSTPAYNDIKKAYKATFTMPDNAVIANMLFATGTPVVTNINSIQADDHLKEAHSLSGQKVTEDYRGIVIVNGRKVVRK